MQTWVPQRGDALDGAAFWPPGAIVLLGQVGRRVSRWNVRSAPSAYLAIAAAAQLAGCSGDAPTMTCSDRTFGERPRSGRVGHDQRFEGHARDSAGTGMFAIDLSGGVTQDSAVLDIYRVVQHAGTIAP